MASLTRVAQAKQSIVAVAKAIVEDKQDLLEGCRQIVAFRAGLSDEASSDPDLLVFVGVESELDDLPGAAERRHWESKALSEADRQRDEYLSAAAGELVRACCALIGKWSD